MCQKKTYSAGRRTGCAAPPQCLQLSSNFLRQSFHKFKHDIESWARNSSRLWQPFTSVAVGSNPPGVQWLHQTLCAAVDSGRSGDQPRGKFGQQTRVARKPESAVRQAGANQPFIELRRPLQAKQVA